MQTSYQLTFPIIGLVTGHKDLHLSDIFSGFYYFVFL